MDEKTRVVWDDIHEIFRCARCSKRLWNAMDFKFCPYCGRQIEGGDW